MRGGKELWNLAAATFGTLDALWCSPPFDLGFCISPASM